jgi:hypothetical protein
MKPLICGLIAVMGGLTISNLFGMPQSATGEQVEGVGAAHGLA